VDPFNTTDKNMENFDTSVQAVRDWSGHAMQQQAWSWLSTNLTDMMNQLKGNVRNDSAKRTKFDKLQENLELNASVGRSRPSVASPSGSCSRPMDGAGGTSLSITKTNKAIKSALVVAGIFLAVKQDDEDADLGGGDQLEDEGPESPSRGARDDDLLPFDTPDFLNEDLENVPTYVRGGTHRSFVVIKASTSGRMLSDAGFPDRRPTTKHQVSPGSTRRSVERPLIVWRVAFSKRTRERARLCQ
jgi:hypothetical protein